MTFDFAKWKAARLSLISNIGKRHGNSKSLEPPPTKRGGRARLVFHKRFRKRADLGLQIEHFILVFFY
jgi:hypothetical protein